MIAETKISSALITNPSAPSTGIRYKSHTSFILPSQWFNAMFGWTCWFVDGSMCFCISGRSNWLTLSGPSNSCWPGRMRPAPWYSATTCPILATFLCLPVPCPAFHVQQWLNMTMTTRTLKTCGFWLTTLWPSLGKENAKPVQVFRRSDFVVSLKQVSLTTRGILLLRSLLQTHCPNNFS